MLIEIRAGVCPVIGADEPALAPRPLIAMSGRF